MENVVKDSNFVLLDELKQNTLEEIYDKVVSLNENGKMSKDDLDTITGALVTLNQVFLKQEKANYIVRQATLADVDSLMEMIEYWAKQGIDIDIEWRNPLLLWKMDEYCDEFEEYMVEEYGDGWEKYWKDEWEKRKDLENYGYDE